MCVRNSRPNFVCFNIFLYWKSRPEQNNKQNIKYIYTYYHSIFSEFVLYVCSESLSCLDLPCFKHSHCLVIYFVATKSKKKITTFMAKLYKYFCSVLASKEIISIVMQSCSMYPFPMFDDNHAFH
jgi:hypothetical protein